MRKGFSLIELSIVLVILGLLVGGVLAGKSLIRSAQLRAISNEHATFMTSINLFQDKYDALPGDFNNAGAIWGLVPAVPCYSAPSTDTKTCNGNSDGRVETAVMISMADGAVSFTYNESNYMWKQLSNIGVINGSFDNLTVYNPSKFQAAYWVPMPLDSMSTGSGLVGNGFAFVTRDGKSQPLVPEDAWNIDTKLDDGKPLAGNIQGWLSNTTESPTACITGSSYTLSSSTPGCSLNFMQPF